MYTAPPGPTSDAVLAHRAPLEAGTLTYTDLAKTLGVTRERIRQLAVRHGIRRRTVAQRVSDELPVLLQDDPSLTAAQLAQRLNVSTAYVYRYANQLGHRFREHRKKRPCTHGTVHSYQTCHCRCADCRAANTAAHRDYLARRADRSAV